MVAMMGEILQILSDNDDDHVDNDGSDDDGDDDDDDDDYNNMTMVIFHVSYLNISALIYL